MVMYLNKTKLKCRFIEHADINNLLQQFTHCEQQSQQLVANNLPLPAYEMMVKASHYFNLLDARHAISVTERQHYILRVRSLSRAVAEAYYNKREALGFPLLKEK